MKTSSGSSSVNITTSKMKNKIIEIYDILYNRYGPQHWWPGDTPWEICVGAVLTQNTNWGNVEKAISRLKKINCLSPRKIISMPRNDLEEAIRPSGYYRLKTGRLLAVTEWWLANVRNNKLQPSGKPLSYWRESILAVKGVGPETADSILLYSFNLPTFVIDTYTKRIMSRHFGTPENIVYHELQKLFLDNLPNKPELFNEYHALLVRMAKSDCRKNSCSPACPLRKIKFI